MFVQIFQGPVSDPEAVRSLLDRWTQELGPDAPGWLGSTAGVTDDGELFVAARFESEDAARANSDRPEQGQWWSELEGQFTSPPVFRDCTEVETFMGGGDDHARFVQVIESEARDLDALRRVADGMAEATPEDMGRPDILGGLLAWHPDGSGLTQIVYFTSEDEARAGEAAPAPEGADDWQAEWEAAVSDIRYLDITDPWLHSAA